MKLLKYCVLSACVICAAVPARAALTAGGVAALDGSGNQRTTFTNVETIALRQVVGNSVASDNMIQFTFTIYNPSGGGVFRHTGNSARATLGNSNSQLSGLAISRFYSVPGEYTFCGDADLTGQPTVHQCAKFQVSSPNINLIYPPYGARGLTDKPLILRWVASGASNYKVTVGESAGMWPLKHEGNSASGMYTYPENPGETEKLVPDKVYYWKVEGMDATGGKIAESTVYSFTMKAEASSQSRNIAVTVVEQTGGETDFAQPLHFRAVVKNVGGTNETNIALKLTLSGVPAQDSPKQIAMLGAGESQELAFTAFMPAGQNEGLAVACVDVFDDNIPDNCKTKLISKSAGQGGVTEGTAEKRTLSYQEMWDEVIKRLGPDVAKALDGYTFDAIDCSNCSGDELNDVMLALMNGGAKLTGATLADVAGAVALAAGQATPETQAEMEEEKELDLELAAPEKQKDQEWSGFTTSVKSATPFFYTVRGKGAWRKVWEMISSEDAPKVDFDEKTVIGVIAGSANKADSVRLIGQRQMGEVTVFEYYMTEATSPNPAAPYIFRTFDKVEGKVEFKRIDVGGK